jgi:hypothetical protein
MTRCLTSNFKQENFLDFDLEASALKSAKVVSANIAGLGNDPVQVFRTGRANHWDFLRLWTGFELPSDRSPWLWVNSKSNYFRFYEVVSN